MNIETVKEYYGKTLQSTLDLKTEACCAPEDMPAHVQALLTNIHDEVQAKYYGCGVLTPLALEGARILDLGCGAGRDVYVLSQLVGSKGEVVGVDMTPEQLAVARTHVDWHTEKFGYGESNVRFLEGYIEDLGALDLEPGSFDVIVSNCVVNLSTDKPAVLEGARALLKPGGEFYFSDVYCDRRLAEGLRNDPVIYGECLGGALYWNDFGNLAKQAGFLDPRLVADRQIAISDKALAARLGQARFFSATYRLFNIDDLEPACEDYGQAVVFKGGLDHAGDAFELDNHHLIEKGRTFPVCGNTWRMLEASRFAPYFEFIGDFSTHYGIFPGCGTDIPYGEQAEKARVSGCC